MNNMKTINERSGYDKAAIIYDILGDSLAINLFTDIPESEFYELRNHAKKIRNTISSSIKKEVLDNYYFKMLASDKFKEEPLSINMFDYLDELNDDQLYILLSREKPRIIALALEQLDNEKRMTFLSKVEQDLQNQIIIQTGTISDIPVEAVIHAAKELKKKTTFLPSPVEFSRGGGKSVAEMLAKMSEDDAKQYLEQMKTDNPNLLADVKKYFLLFDDIIAMPDKIASGFWADPGIELDMMAKSLKEVDSETIEKLQGYLPGKRQAMFAPIPEDEALSRGEIDEAKTIIKDLLQSKIDAGEIKIEDTIINQRLYAYFNLPLSLSSFLIFVAEIF